MQGHICKAIYARPYMQGHICKAMRRARAGAFYLLEPAVAMPAVLDRQARVALIEDDGTLVGVKRVPSSEGEDDGGESGPEPKQGEAKA